MVYILLNEARKRGADCLATVCPLCQFNLDGYHAQLRSQYGDAVLIPTVYFSQLMGLAFGLPAEELGLQRAAIPFRLAAGGAGGGCGGRAGGGGLIERETFAITLTSYGQP